eukprot:CAMPEP_0204366340 /NCGR_PEP_ID=MMETSP0469-20131031/42594_1 /ASSEMBLY_ACC=CAM_ASM_000384 /TAXON_ID=2969 /ORGANISM="Oxyrrhis marina" /LENGTH=109 /DNA_ID=CAMNT_0051355533 /DNA_START=215 /DNA_END=541 /DNA_ORIENTATION=-
MTCLLFAHTQVKSQPNWATRPNTPPRSFSQQVHQLLPAGVTDNKIYERTNCWGGRVHDLQVVATFADFAKGTHDHNAVGYRGRQTLRLGRWLHWAPVLPEHPGAAHRDP